MWSAWAAVARDLSTPEPVEELPFQELWPRSALDEELRGISGWLKWRQTAENLVTTEHLMGFRSAALVENK